MAKRWGRGTSAKARARPVRPAPAVTVPRESTPGKPVPPSAFLFEIRAQCRIAHQAFQEIEGELTGSRVARRAMVEEVEAASRINPGPATGSLKDAIGTEANRSVRLLGLVQTMLAAAGIVSTALWPSKSRAGGTTEAGLAKRQSRGEVLRRLFEVGDDSPLAFRDLREKDVRGGMLHFDEMIDQFASIHPGQQVRSLDIGALEAANGWSPEAALRSLDENTLVLRVQGTPPRTCDLRALDTELVRIGSRIQMSATVSTVRRPGRVQGQSGASFHLIT